MPIPLDLTPRLPALALYARQWVDAATADDVVQSALVALWSQWRSPADPAAWTFRAVRNGAISAARGSNRRRKHERSAARSDWFEPCPADLIDARAAESSLSELPESLREAVVLRLWGDLGFAEIAAVTGVSVSTAHGRYAAGIGQLRIQLEVPCPPT